MSSKTILALPSLDDGQFIEDIAEVLKISNVTILQIILISSLSHLQLNGCKLSQSMGNLCL
jgi:hypothetical protein